MPAESPVPSIRRLEYRLLFDRMEVRYETGRPYVMRLRAIQSSPAENETGIVPETELRRSGRPVVVDGTVIERFRTYWPDGPVRFEAA